MDSFLEKFFPSVYRKQKADDSTNQYCKFDSVTLTLFTSSLYLAALLSSVVASTVTRKLGRKLSMLLGGVLFCAGALINGFAQGVWMLIVGRILLGFGIGFANQVLTQSFCMRKRFYLRFYFLFFDQFRELNSVSRFKRFACCRYSNSLVFIASCHNATKTVFSNVPT